MASKLVSPTTVAVLLAVLMAAAGASASQDPIASHVQDWANVWEAMQATVTEHKATTARHLATCSGTGTEQMAAFAAALQTQWCAPYAHFFAAPNNARRLVMTRADFQASANAFCGTGRLPVPSRCYVEIKTALGAEAAGECSQLTAQRAFFGQVCTRATAGASAGAADDGTGAPCIADFVMLTQALATGTPGALPALTADTLNQVCNECTANTLAAYRALNPLTSASLRRICVRDPATDDFCWVHVLADLQYLSNPVNAANFLTYAAERACTTCGKVTMDLMIAGFKAQIALDPTNVVAAQTLAAFRVLSRYGCGSFGGSTCAAVYLALFAQSPADQATLFTTMQGQCPADHSCPAGCVGVLQGVQAQYGCCFRGLLEFLELQGLLAIADPTLTADIALANINNDCAAGGISMDAMCRDADTTTESYRMVFRNVLSTAVIGVATNEANVKTGVINMLEDGTGYASSAFTVTDVRAHGDNAVAVTVQIQGNNNADTSAALLLTQRLTRDNAWDPTPFTAATGSSVQADAAASVTVVEDGPASGAAAAGAGARVVAAASVLVAAFAMAMRA